MAAVERWNRFATPFAVAKLALRKPWRLQPAITLPPAVEGLVGDAGLLAGLGDAAPLAQQHVNFAQLVDDLLRCKPFPRHDQLS